MLKKYLMAIALLLGAACNNAYKFQFANRYRKNGEPYGTPVKVKLKFVGEVNWGELGCTLCPEEKIVAGNGDWWIGTGLKIVKRIEVFDTQGKFLAGKDMGNNLNVDKIFLDGTSPQNIALTFVKDGPGARNS